MKFIEEISGLLEDSAPSDFAQVDAEVINRLRERYREDLEAIYHQCNQHVALTEFDKTDMYRVERHMFPALLVGEELDMPANLARTAAQVFVQIAGLPTIVLNHQLDDSENVVAKMVAHQMELIYGGVGVASSDLPKETLEVIVSEYKEVSQEMGQERARRYSIDFFNLVELPDRKAKNVIYYRSDSHYQKAVILAAAHAGGASVSNNTLHALNWLGVARQVTDEVTDVDNDIGKGLITLPVRLQLPAGQSRALESDIERLWAGKMTVEKLNKRYDGFASGKLSVLDFAEDLITEMLNYLRQEKCNDKVWPVARLYYLWRLAQLKRIRSNLDTSELDSYANIATSAVIESYYN